MGIVVMPTGSFSWESMVVDDYVSGKIEIDQLEEEVWEILHGKTPQRLIPGVSPFPRPFMTETLER